jgi:hypothetical protein
MAQRRLRDIGLRRRPGKAALPRNHQEREEIIDVPARHS